MTGSLSTNPLLGIESFTHPPYGEQLMS